MLLGHNFEEFSCKLINTSVTYDVVTKQGHKLVLWTSRGEPALEEAINWWHKQGLEFDSFQVNPFTKKTSGPSPKILADYYIDDKALSFGSNDERDKTLAFLEYLRNG